MKFHLKVTRRAALEDHFFGKRLGLPMDVNVCYTNRAEADQNDRDTLLALLGTAASWACLEPTTS